MIKEETRRDEIDKDLFKLISLHKHISNTNPFDPKLHNLTQKIDKLQREKKNWEMLYNAAKGLGESADVPPAHIQQQPSIPTNVINQKQLQNAYILAATLWGEARGEGEQGMQAVMNVIMNRSKGDFNKAVGIVLKPKQFSFWNNKPNQIKYSVDLANKLRNSKDKQYLSALKIVDSALKHQLKDITGGAKFYFNPKLANPKWAKKMVKTVRIGNHDFYKLPQKKVPISTKENIFEMVEKLILECIKELN